MKRIFDFILAAAGLLVFAPLFILISLAILVTMGFPVFFTQTRIGRHGKPFRIIKFRSMITDADKKGLSITRGGDPRITPLGKSLRKTKLDELPQLINVLCGQMSFVGPRPETPEYVELYDDQQRQVLTVRPGITDPATLAFRNEEEVLSQYEDTHQAYVDIVMPQKLKINLEYLQTATLFTDLRIVLKTINALFKTANSLPNDRI